MIMHLRLTVLALIVSQSCLQAGVYSPEEKCPFKIRSDGTAESLSFDENGFGQYKLLLGHLGDVGTMPPRPTPPARKVVLDRISRLQTDPGKDRDPAKLAGLAVDLIRVRNLDAALNTLALKSRDRNPDFRVLATLAHVHAVRGEWAEAIQRHQAALFDCEFPKDLAGTNAEQRTWLHRIEKEYYPRWLRIHKQETDRKLPPADEDVFPLFEGKPPADAIAIVQQLLIWQPDDSRLHWLLADLYGQASQWRQAERLYNELAEGRQQSNRRKLMEARSHAKQMAATMAPAAAEVEPIVVVPPDTAANTTMPKKEADLLTELGLTPTQVITVGGIVGIVVVLLMALQLRSIRRRRA